jgi:hypothetical protein
LLFACGSLSPHSSYRFIYEGIELLWADISDFFTEAIKGSEVSVPLLVGLLQPWVTLTDSNVANFKIPLPGTKSLVILSADDNGNRLALPFNDDRLLVKLGFVK